MQYNEKIIKKTKVSEKYVQNWRETLLFFFVEWQIMEDNLMEGQNDWRMLWWNDRMKEETTGAYQITFYPSFIIRW